MARVKLIIRGLSNDGVPCGSCDAPKEDCERLKKKIQGVLEKAGLTNRRIHTMDLEIFRCNLLNKAPKIPPSGRM